ncbi:hypothetical protein P691DRAFT_771599 [Macrolepiota fuliginosa MF-IS2]|uniref:Uncharacterized protein n=1 Tax=Macrolepiota fuliginosa MF-IS2 TaxID=1400762 RepID=A0A9P6C658_9AGAR|nr:hypothetical protein P691DRAFT_771599 [Macrolepiota fuliginosa MF-IS2]
MIIVRFRLWLDGARVAFLALFQGGATVTFTLFKSSLPCNNLGSVQTCKTMSTVAIFVGWSLAGLPAMSYVPQPPPPTNPEESITDDRNKSGHYSSPSLASSKSSSTLVVDSDSDTWKGKERHSLSSNPGSEYSQTYWIGSRATTPHSRTTSLASRSTTRTEQYGVYRPNTPQSILSPAASSISSSIYPVTTAPSYNAGRFTPQPSGYYRSPVTVPSPSASAPKTRLPHLPNPFSESPSRSGTPASVASFRSDGFLYTGPYAHTRSLTGQTVPPSLLAGAPSVHPPAYEDRPRGVLPGNMREGMASPSPRPELAFERHIGNSTPLTIRPGAPAGYTRDSTKSPGSMTVLSQSASIWQLPPSRSGSLLSVPRSPSPYNIPPHVGLPSSPRAHLLHAHPQLHPVALRGPQRFQETRKIGSPPDPRAATDSTTGLTTGSVQVQRSPVSTLRSLPTAPDQSWRVHFTLE